MKILILALVLIAISLAVAASAQAQQPGFQYLFEVRYIHPFQHSLFQTPLQQYMLEERPFRLLEADESLFAYLAVVKAMQRPASASADPREMFRRMYNRPSVDQNKQVRQMWAEAFGVDIWYPYFKAKEVEGWVKKRVSVRVFNFKGEVNYEKNKVMYSFKKKF